MSPRDGLERDEARDLFGRRVLRPMRQGEITLHDWQPEPKKAGELDPMTVDMFEGLDEGGPEPEGGS